MTRLLRILTGLLLLPLGACAIFNARYNRWDRKIPRNKDEVAEFAAEFQMGNGKTALLMIHGFGDGPGVWKGLAAELANKGFHVHAIRLPGWGEPMDVKRDIERDDWLTKIESELETLQADHEQVAVMAHSMGGCLAGYLAQDGRLNADALILYAPMFAVSNARSPILSTRRWQAIGSAILPDDMVVESLFQDHARVGEPRPKHERDPFVPIHLFDVLYDLMDDFTEQEARVDLPVCLVLPGEDRVVRSDVAREWFEKLAAPAKTLREENEAGHVLPLDLNFHRESDRIALWLQENLKGPATDSN
ncbi:MAG: alpha/beta hydrolase [Kiritimatiellae bacterium]|nr:alpha/beta hydrolase [Kiritimatiellia bacterium]